MRAALPLVLLATLALAACDLNGDEDVARADSTVTVAYEGRLEDGTVFDESDRARFSLRQVIPGFRDNVVGMRVGESKTFSVPPEDAYGTNPPPNSDIPPNATLIFDVTLLDVD
ncbi:MAG: FKBP-type peptidyl-prolyl cis-trans isomerase [Rhodothermales bacterium]|nr:FKBP-type peptidyl-prolyl cis-trans isomerase [Rhodothermales bacterium]